MNKLEQIQQTLLEIYNKNIEFFKLNYTNIYNDIKIFEEKNSEDYFIDFINDHFELLDNKGNKTYNCDPFYDAQHRVNNIYNAYSGIAMIDQKKRYVDSDEKYDYNLFINQYLKLIKNNTIQTSTKFNKMIFVGTLLGVHLNDIDKVVNCDSYLIVEDNIEIFRLSLFLTDYEQLAKNSKLFFAIDKDGMELEQVIKTFLSYNYQYNYFIKYEVVSDKYIDILENISNIIASLNPSIYPFSELIRSFINGIENFKYSTNGILNLNKQNNILSKYNILFLGAGPSLAKNIDFIKKNQDKFIIVTGVSIIKRLSDENIIPDIIISIDSDDIVEYQISVDKKYHNNSIILCSINTNTKVIKAFNNKNLFLVQNSLEFFTNMGILTGVTVGDVGVKILLQLGAKNIYLCGIDAAFDQNSGETHDNTHINSTKKRLKKSNLLENEDIGFTNKVIKVKGNFQEEVYTTVYYKTIIDSFKTIIKDIDQKIYNISNGAYLDGTIPKKSQDICIDTSIDKEDLQKDFLKLFDNISKDSLDKIDNLSFKNELNYLKDNDIKNSLSYQIVEYYHKLLDQYYYYILDNNIDNKNILDEIQNKQLSIIKQELKNSLIRIKF